MTVRLFLAKGRESPYSVATLRCSPVPFNALRAKPSGEAIDILDSQGKWLARGAYSPESQIRARVWTFQQDEEINIDFFIRRLQQAQSWRDWSAQRDGLDGYRLIAGESDGLPGITIDRFQNFLVLQLLSAGAEYQRPALLPPCSIATRNVRFTIAPTLRCAKKKACRWRRAGAGRSAAGTAAYHRARHEAAGGHSARAQDRFLPRPARQSPGGAELLCWPPGAELLLPTPAPSPFPL